MPDNNPILARYMLKTPEELADMHAHRYDYLKDPSLPAPSPAHTAALEEAYGRINGARPVQNDPGKAQPISEPVVESNPLTAANEARLRQQAVAVPMTPADRAAAAQRNYDIINGRRPLNDPPAPPPMAPAPIAPDPYDQRAAVEPPEVEPEQFEPLPAMGSPARQFTAEMLPRGEDPRVRIPGIRSQEVNPGILEDDYIVDYDQYGQPVRRGIAPHASDYQVPANDKWSGAQSFAEQANKKQLAAIQIMIQAGIDPVRAERMVILGESMTTRERDVIRANDKFQRQRQIDQENARRKNNMGDSYYGNLSKRRLQAGRGDSERPDGRARRHSCRTATGTEPDEPATALPGQAKIYGRW